MHGTNGHNTARRASQQMGTVGRGLLGPWDPGAEIRPGPGSAGLIWCSLTTLGLPWAPCLSRYLPDRPSAPGTFPAHPAWPAPRPPWSPGPPTACHDSPVQWLPGPWETALGLWGHLPCPQRFQGSGTHGLLSHGLRWFPRTRGGGAAWALPLFRICSGGRGQEGQQKAAPTGRTGQGHQRHHGRFLPRGLSKVPVRAQGGGPGPR